MAIREACKDAGLSVTGSAMKTLTPSVRRAGWNAWLRYACNHREWACGKDASDEDKRCILANFVNSAGEGRLSKEKPQDLPTAEESRNKMTARQSGWLKGFGTAYKKIGNDTLRHPCYKRLRRAYFRHFVEECMRTKKKVK